MGERGGVEEFSLRGPMGALSFFCRLLGLVLRRNLVQQACENKNPHSIPNTVRVDNKPSQLKTIHYTGGRHKANTKNIIHLSKQKFWFYI